MSRSWITTTLAIGATLLVGDGVVGTAEAQAIERCHAGQRVVTPGGRVGSVVTAQGAGCTVRRDGDPAHMVDTWGAFMLRPVEGSPVRNPPPSRDLPIGEYAGYGSGQRVLAGLGFEPLPGDTTPTSTVPGRGVTPSAARTSSSAEGHLDGQTGRDIEDKGFTIGQMASCQLW